MASLFYNAFKAGLFSGANPIDFDADTIKVMLVTSVYVPLDAHTFESDVTNEVSGPGYQNGGKALAGKTVTRDDVLDLGVFDADDVEWQGSTITARGAVLYKDAGPPGSSPLIAYIDFLTDRASVLGIFLITWSAQGILTVGEG